MASNRVILLALRNKPSHADENWLSESAGRCVTAVPVGPYLYKQLDESNEAWERQGVFVREPRATPHSKKLVPKIAGFLKGGSNGSKETVYSTGGPVPGFRRSGAGLQRILIRDPRGPSVGVRSLTLEEAWKLIGGTQSSWAQLTKCSIRQT